MISQLPPQAHAVATAFVAAPNITEDSIVKMASAVLTLKGTTDISSADPTVRRRLLSGTFVLKLEHLPRQARDRHRKS
jgi:hypothetical protein